MANERGERRAQVVRPRYGQFQQGRQFARPRRNGSVGAAEAQQLVQRQPRLQVFDNAHFFEFLARQLGTPAPIEQSHIDSLYERYQNVYGQRGTNEQEG